MNGNKQFRRVFITVAIWAVLAAGVASAAAGQEPNAVNWDRARRLHRRASDGQTLTAEERAYLDRAREQRRRSARGSATRGASATARQESPSQADRGSIDWDRARRLYERSRRGGALTTQEKAYLDRARRTRQRERARSSPQRRTTVVDPPADQSEGIDWKVARELLERQNNGLAMTPQEIALLDKARLVRRRYIMNLSAAQSATGLVPLNQMSAAERYKGQDGGLYGKGKNNPPPLHQRAATEALARIVPLDSQGNPAPDGKIVLISIGMSNTTQEFSRFKEIADADPAKSSHVILVDCAQGGQDVAKWSEQAGDTSWEIGEDRLAAAGVTPKQVQVAWIKHARIRPAQYGEYPAHAEECKGHFLSCLNIAKRRFPNLRIAFLSSRIYAGYAVTPLNPEPYAYEGALAMRGLIQDQIGGAAELNCDASKGQVNAPLLLWGPYLWGDGMTPRESDRLVWKREDFADDGTHPSSSGRQQVAELLLRFFKTNPNAKGWYLKPSADIEASRTK